MKGIHIDAESDVVGTHYAIVYTPRRSRGRFPVNCVEIVNDLDEALAGSDPDEKKYPARVVGPSRSSEGVMLYYLDCWLADE
ncbi:MAG: hypothetical protein ACWGOV_00435 [Acidiferrobacterales bacterium]